MTDHPGGPDRPVAPGTVTRRYGDHPDQVTEEWPGPGPVVVVIHGGFWREEHDRAHLRPMAAALNRAGATVVLPEYRRTGGAGGWPETFDDVSRALAAVVADHPAGFLLSGHRAGGHLALWAASAGPPGLRAVVALAPVADLAAADRLGLDGDAAAALVGGHVTDLPSRYRQLDPVQLPSPACPVTLLHAVDDPLVPFSLAEAYLAAHPRSRLETVTGGHFGVVEPTSEAWPSVQVRLLG